VNRFITFSWDALAPSRLGAMAACPGRARRACDRPRRIADKPHSPRRGPGRGRGRP
jgi:hypothetical protein